MTKRFLTAGIVAAVLLAGCGSSPTSSSNKFRNRSPLQGSTPLGMPTGPAGQMVPGMPAGGGDVQGLLGAIAQAQNGVQGFQATIESFEKGPKDEETQTLKLTYKKPSTLRIHITQGKGQSQDAKVLWTGGSDLKVKPSFLPFSVSKPINDEAIKTRNGWTIKDTQPKALVDVLLDPAAGQQILGENTVAGMQLVMVQCRSAKSPKGATHEIIGVNKANMLPAFREVYKGQTVIYRIVLKGLKIGVPSSSEFEI